MATTTRWLAPLVLVTALQIFSVAHAQTETPPPSQPRGSDWIRLPTGAQISEKYPIRALREDIEGRVQLKCLVTDQGALTDCSVISETPKGYGFGKAALKLSAYFAMQKTTVDGKPVGGAFVNVSIPFRVK